MGTYKHVIETATGDLLRCGYLNFVAGEGEEIRTDGPVPGTPIKECGTGQYDRYLGPTEGWVKVDQPPSGDAVFDSGVHADHAHIYEGGIESSGPVETERDFECMDPYYGVVLVDRTTGERWRIYIDNGSIQKEQL